MKRHAQRHALSSLSELNVSPLIDLAFVLLIIFIISTPLLEQTLDVAVPESATAEEVPEEPSTHFISLDAQGQLFLDEERIQSLEELRGELAILLEGQPAAPFIVRADQSLRVQHLVDLLDLLKESGATRIGIATRKPQPQSQSPPET